MAENIELNVFSGQIIRLCTKGKYCDKDIVINAIRSGSGPSTEPIINPLEVTKNGVYTAPDGVDGYSPVTVNVPTSGGSGDERLPDGYTRVDYIQFTEEQFVDTGIICNQDTKIRTIFTREKSAQHYMFGVASSDNTASVTAYLGGNWRFGNKGQTKSPTAREDIVYCGIMSKSEITMTGSVSNISGVNDFETLGTLVLGSCRGSSGDIQYPTFMGKTLVFEICQGDELVQQYVPAFDAEGVFGFYETVKGEFHTSLTDVPFTGGYL